MTSFVAAVQDAERAQLIVDLRAARAELVTRGWCKDHFVDDEMRVCALGAIGSVVVSNFAQLSLLEQETVRAHNSRCDRAEMALFSVLGVPVDCFNDRQDTTYQDVLDLFDKTLADLGGLA